MRLITIYYGCWHLILRAGTYLSLKLIPANSLRLRGLGFLWLAILTPRVFSITALTAEAYESFDDVGHHSGNDTENNTTESISSSRNVSPLPGGIRYGEKTMIILAANQNTLQSTLFLGVQNSSPKPLQASLPLIHPQKAREVFIVEAPGHSATATPSPADSHQNSSPIPTSPIPTSVIARDNGRGFALSTVVPPGHHVYVLRFSVPLSGFQKQSVSYKLPVELENLIILKSEAAGFSVKAPPPFRQVLPDQLARSSFTGWTRSTNLPQGHTVTFELSSLPTSRQPYYLLGAALALLLILGSGASMYWRNNLQAQQHLHPMII